MTFSPTAQLLLDGVWTDITADVRQADGIQITRGRSSEADAVDASECALTVDNRSGDYAPRNPVGAHFGVLGRNTQMRVLGPAAGDNYVLLSGGVNSSNSASGPACFAATNTVGPFTSGGDLDLRIEVEPLSWRPSTDQGLATEHWTEGTGALAWKLRLLTTGHLAFTWSPDGTTANGITETSLIPVPADSGRIAVRVTLDVVAGVQHGVGFYTAPTIGGAYSGLGSFTISGAATSVFTGSSVIEVGRALWNNAPEMFQGKVYAFEFRNGINGVLAASADFTALDSGDTEFDDAQANSWGLRGRAVMANPSARCHTEVSAWPQRWDKSDTDFTTPVQGYGILRRLGQGIAPLRSVMYRAQTAVNAVVAYWPCEDKEDAEAFASALPSHPPMYPNGEVTKASYTGFKCSDPLPVVASTAAWTGTVPAYTTTGETQVYFLMRLGTGAISGSAAVCRIQGTGSVQRWDLDAHPTNGLRLRAFDSEDNNVLSTAYFPFDIYGQRVRVSVELEQDGADINYTIATIEVGETTGFAINGTLTGQTVGRVVRVSMNAYGDTLTDVVLGHISVQNRITSVYDLRTELNAFTGEVASARILRLCHEEGIPVSVVGDVTDSTPLGPQLPGSLVELLAEAAASDLGILYEPREHLGLAYRTRASMYAQEAALTLDYGAGTVSGIEPTEDDDVTRNDITVQRINGSSYRAELTSGPLSVNAPPLGVGRYDEEQSISLNGGSQLPDQAHWRLHMGTVDEPRYPVIGVNLANSAFTSDPVLTADAQGLDIGGRLVISGAPSAATSPDDIQQIAQGFTETLTPFEWLIDVNCTPASVWDVAVWDDESGPGEARYSSDGTTLEAAVSSSATVLRVDTPTGPLWSGADAPYDIVVGGERMTVTGVVTNVDNASFETNGAWTVTGTDATVSQSTFEALHGVYAALVTIDGTPTSEFNGVALDDVSVTAGQWLAVHVPVRPDGATPVAGARVRIQWLDAAGANLGTDTSARVALTAFTYNTVTHSALAPVNTASAVVTLYFAGAASNVPAANSTGRTDAWAVAAGASQAEALALVAGGYAQQFMAVTRSVNGVVKTHAAGADLALAKPAIYAL